jgi:cysteine-rich repeat protein
VRLNPMITLLLWGCAPEGPSVGPGADTGLAAEQAPPPSFMNNQAASMGPSTDLNGDGRADVCARTDAGLRCELSNGTTFPTVATTSLFSDASGFNDPKYYRSLRFGDITGDGKADVCVRTSGGVSCLRSTGTGWSLAPIIAGPPWSDPNFDSLTFNDSIRMLDVNRDGMQDLCGPTGVADGGIFLNPGYTCHLSTGTGFGPAQRAMWDPTSAQPEWSTRGVSATDHNGLSYATHTFPSSGDPSALVWIRGEVGGEGLYFRSWPFQEPGASYYTGWSDWDGQLDADSLPTLTFANLLPGPDLELAVHGAAGVELLTWEDTRDFSLPRLLLGPAQGDWYDPATTDTILWGDFTGDGLDDLCARTSAGMRCRINLGNGSMSSEITGPTWSTANGWSAEASRSTLRMADINGDQRADLCGRGPSGFRCALSLGLSFAAEATPNGWTDATGWTDAANYLTVSAAALPPDADGDLVPNGADACPTDLWKTQPGVCGCGLSDDDTDGDGTRDCFDGCPTDPAKLTPGVCGCGTAETDSDADGTPDCVDLCPTDPAKTDPGSCGCGVPETDTDGDGSPNCVDDCPTDPGKTTPGTCGCGTPDDADADGYADCLPCGDGARRGAEACDDGAHVAGDGCSPTCTLEDLLILSVAPGTAGTSNTLTAGGGTPGANVTLVVSTRAGSTPIPGCPGVSAPLAGPITVLGARAATGASRAVFTFTPPASAAGVSARFVAVELSSCRVSPVWVEVL